MSEQAVAEAETGAAASEEKPLFDRQEIEFLESEDVKAGRALGKMLSLFFLYTILAMGLAAWWTWDSIFARGGHSSVDTSAPNH